MVTYLYGRDGQVAACRLYIKFCLSTRANENPWQSLGIGGINCQPQIMSPIQDSMDSKYPHRMKCLCGTCLDSSYHS